MSGLRSVGRGDGRAVPVDLVAVLALVLAANMVVVWTGVGAGTLSLLVGFVFFLFAPGYAFVAALFPEAGGDLSTRTVGTGETARFDSDVGLPGRLRERGVDGVERFVFAVGTSVAVLPLCAFLVNATDWGIRPEPMTLALSAFTLVATGVALVRRLRTPPEDRYRVPLREWVPARPAFADQNRIDMALNALLVCSLLLAAGSAGYVVVMPPAGDTEFAMLTQNETGALVAGGYPTEFERGQSKPVVLSIANQEHETVEYTVVVKLQRVRTAGGSITVEATRELQRITTRVEHGGTWRGRYDITPTLTGERFRMVFLLYRGDTPDRPTVDNADRRLQLWINVSGGGV